MNTKTFWDYFKSKRFTDAGCAGLLANIKAESNFNTKNLQGSFEKKLGMTDEQYTIAVDNGSYTNFINDGAGYGLAQWTWWELKRDLLNFCRDKKVSIGDELTQLDFLHLQLTIAYPQVGKILMTSDSIKECSNTVLLKYERPADQGPEQQARRIKYAEEYYNMYANNSYSPIVCMQTNSTCYRKTREMKVKGVLWHSTGANNPYISRYVQPLESDANYKEMIALLGKNKYGNDWNHIEMQAGVNAWIGKLADNSIATVQTMPWNYRPWGCGKGKSGSCNDGWFQFEIKRVQSPHIAIYA